MKHVIKPVNLYLLLLSVKFSVFSLAILVFPWCNVTQPLCKLYFYFSATDQPLCSKDFYLYTAHYNIRFIRDTFEI